MLFDVPLPSIFESFDAIWRKDDIQIKRSVSELDEILAAPNLLLLIFSEQEMEL